MARSVIRHLGRTAIAASLLLAASCADERTVAPTAPADERISLTMLCSDQIIPEPDCDPGGGGGDWVPSYQTITEYAEWNVSIADDRGGREI